MLDEQIRRYAQEKGFHPVTVNRWLSWHEADKEALLDLAVATSASESHLRVLIDWLEEICLRDGIVITETLATQPIPEIKTDPRLGRSDKLKRIKNQIRRLRFPRLSEIEDLIQAGIRDLKLKAPIRLSVPAGLEGAKLHVELDASSQAELVASIRALAEAAQKSSMEKIFALLHGETFATSGDSGSN
jgi:hypothetical protein